MDSAQDVGSPELNTIAMLGGAYSLLGFRIVDGVVRAGFPQKPSHSAVFAQIEPTGSRLTELARGANMTPQATGELVDELEELGYVVRRPDDCHSRRHGRPFSLADTGAASVVPLSLAGSVVPGVAGSLLMVSRRPRRVCSVLSVRSRPTDRGCGQAAVLGLVEVEVSEQPTYPAREVGGVVSSNRGREALLDVLQEVRPCAAVRSQHAHEFARLPDPQAYVGLIPCSHRIENLQHVQEPPVHPSFVDNPQAFDDEVVGIRRHELHPKTW